VLTRPHKRSTTKTRLKNSLSPLRHFTEHLVGVFEKLPWENDLDRESSRLLIRRVNATPEIQPASIKTTPTAIRRGPTENRAIHCRMKNTGRLNRLHQLNSTHELKIRGKAITRKNRFRADSCWSRACLDKLGTKAAAAQTRSRVRRRTEWIAARLEKTCVRTLSPQRTEPARRRTGPGAVLRKIHRKETPNSGGAET
jgi:hypothetical protein